MPSQVFATLQVFDSNVVPIQKQLDGYLDQLHHIDAEPIELHNAPARVVVDIAVAKFVALAVAVQLPVMQS